MQCEQCGGTVRYHAALHRAACLFCGATQLHPTEPERVSHDQPEDHVPFTLDLDHAKAHFHAWARSSWWYSARLRSGEVELHPLWVPVWAVEADLESHWAGLAPAPNHSGRQPRSGQDLAHGRALIPASGALRRGELARLGDFPEAHARPWGEPMDTVPQELPALSRAAATARARSAFEEERLEAIRRAEHLKDCRLSLAVSNPRVRLRLLPVYVGAVEMGRRPLRFVMNGVTGQVAGTPPVDRRKVGLVFLLVLLGFALLAWLR